MPSKRRLERKKLKALIEGDIEFVKQYMGHSDRPHEFYECVLHKARYESTEVEDKLRYESGKWLVENGYSAMAGATPKTHPLEGPLP